MALVREAQWPNNQSIGHQFECWLVLCPSSRHSHGDPLHAGVQMSTREFLEKLDKNDRLPTMDWHPFRVVITSSCGNLS